MSVDYKMARCATAGARFDGVEKELEMHSLALKRRTGGVRWGIYRWWRSYATTRSPACAISFGGLARGYASTRSPAGAISFCDAARGVKEGLVFVLSRLCCCRCLWLLYGWLYSFFNDTHSSSGKFRLFVCVCVFGGSIVV